MYTVDLKSEIRPFGGYIESMIATLIDITQIALLCAQSAPAAGLAS